MTEHLFFPPGDTTTKRCTKCEKTLLLAEFYPYEKGWDGVRARCKMCCKAASKARYDQDDSYGKARNDRHLEARLELKRELVAAAGGCCTHCGYSRSLYALDFHHTGGDKENTLANLIAKSARNANYTEQALAEAAKCILLCSNCHRELHAGEWSF